MNPFVKRALTLYEQGKNDAAAGEYRRGIANDPLDSDNWFGLAELLHELGRDQQAVETYTLALSTIEHAPELRLPFAELLMESRRKADAIKVLQRGIELDPEATADLRLMLGNVLVGVLDDSSAATSYSRTSDVSASASASTTVSSTKASKAAGARSRHHKRKKLCKLFCPGSLEPAAPKPN